MFDSWLRLRFVKNFVMLIYVISSTFECVCPVDLQMIKGKDDLDMEVGEVFRSGDGNFVKFDSRNAIHLKKMYLKETKIIIFPHPI